MKTQPHCKTENTTKYPHILREDYLRSTQWPVEIEKAGFFDFADTILSLQFVCLKQRLVELLLLLPRIVQLQTIEDKMHCT